MDDFCKMKIGNSSIYYTICHNPLYLTNNVCDTYMYMYIDTGCKHQCSVH